MTSRWRVDRIEGVSAPAYTTLTHLDEPAELLFRGGRLARGPGYGSASIGARRALARTGAILRLRQRNRFFVHSAGVVDPRGRAWLLIGESGTGKSTMAYALVREGWSLLGEDGVIIEPGEPHNVVHAWRSPLLVSAALGAHFPELARHADRVLPGDGRRRIAMDARRATRATVSALVVLRRDGMAALTTLDRASVVAELLRQSPWVLLPDRDAAAHFRALAGLAQRAATFRLVHGPAELTRVAKMLLAALP